MARVQKTFSEIDALDNLLQNKEFCDTLEATSRNGADVVNRVQTYADVMSNYESQKEIIRYFSGVNDVNFIANQYFNATMSSNVRSFSGYLSIEKACDKPEALIGYRDILGVTDNRVVLPNIGKENLEGIFPGFTLTSALTPGGTQEYTVATTKKIVKGSVELHLVPALTPNSPVVIKDDGKGTLLAPAGVLTPNADSSVNVNYQTGKIKFTIGSSFTVATGDYYTITGHEDVSGDPEFGQLNGHGNNRFKVKENYIKVVSQSGELVGEFDLVSLASAMKTAEYSLDEMITMKLTELYTKTINKKQVEEIKRKYDGTTHEINMAAYVASFTDFQSRIASFQSELLDINTALAYKTTKAVKATAYLVGRKTALWFQKMGMIGQWNDNLGNSQYVSDLLGFANGNIPVLRHTDLDDNEGFAIHKTENGEMAPLLRGIYLPLTWTGNATNWNNPTQVAKAVFYYESNKSVFPELTQRFIVKE